MKSNRIFATNNINHQIHMKKIPNSETVSRQIESLRIVLRRVKNNQSSKLDSFIDQKLKEAQ